MICIVGGIFGADRAAGSSLDVGGGHNEQHGPRGARLWPTREAAMAAFAFAGAHQSMTASNCKSDNANDRERLNSGVQSILVKEMFRPAELVERIRRLVHTNPAADSKMEATL